MGDSEHYGRLLRAFHRGLIAGPDVYVFCGQLPRKLSKGSGHVRQSGVKHEFLVAGNSVTFQRLLGLGPVVYHELYVTHGPRATGIQSQNIHLRAAKDTCDARQRSRSIITRNRKLLDFGHWRILRTLNLRNPNRAFCRGQQSSFVCRRKMRMSGLCKVEMSAFMGGRGPMETERIALSQRERDRLRVLQDVQQGHLTQVAAAQRIKITDRQVRRLLLRLREQGDRAVIHGLRGRPSNRKFAARFEQKILARVRQRYADFGPTLAAEHLAKEGLPVSRETLRKWMTKAAFWRPRSQRVKKIHVWRERRASFGELVMQDSSPFRWLEERGPACQLIALIDDATSRVWARFTEHDTTEENLRTLGGWLRRYGRPLAHYTDKNSIFRTAGSAAVSEQLRGEAGARSQFGRALGELRIEWIAAQSPQAKGRIERLFETLQDRLVKEMRLAGIATLEAANHFLETRFLPEWEQRFTVTPRNPRNAHRRLGREHRLEEILSVRVARKVAEDHTVSWDGNRWGVPREEVCAGLRGAQVEIERRLDGSHWLRFRDRYLRLRHCPEPAPRAVSPSGLRPPGLTAHPVSKTRKSVPPQHPWRTFQYGRKPDISTLR